jgi:hypothetical protein
VPLASSSSSCLVAFAAVDGVEVEAFVAVAVAVVVAAAAVAAVAAVAVAAVVDLVELVPQNDSPLYADAVVYACYQYC